MNKRVEYSTFERKLIYAFSVENSEGKLDYYDGLKKIGDTSISNFKIDARDDSEDLKNEARKRIKQYAGTSGLPYKIDISRLAVTNDNHFYRDYDVHSVLNRSGYKKEILGEGNEWYKVTNDVIIEAIKAVEEGRSSIDPSLKNENISIQFRQEQLLAIKQTKETFKNKKKMLWNAKMRFGKTLSALQVIKDNCFKKTLIITHRPIVSDGWFDDFNKIFTKEDGYLIGSKLKGEKINYLSESKKPFIYFASMQDLRGLAVFGGSNNTENKIVAEIKWDFIIIDEAHEGIRTEIAENVLSHVTKEAKLLELSGTPFNILDEYEENQVFTWDYVMEQEAKHQYSVDNPELKNPYESLPKVNMYTFELGDKFKNQRFFSTEDKAFNFMEFFKVNHDGKFQYESNVQAFLNEITKHNPKTNYPFSTDDFRANLRHTLWLLPSVASCAALKKLLDKHPVFKEEYQVINIVDNGDENGTSENDLERVRKAITTNPSQTKTITLTVRKLTTGVNIPEWTGVVFLNNTNSPTSYLQAAFRAQTPFSDKELGMKTDCYIFDFAPDRALTIMTSAARLNSGVGKKTTNIQREQMQKFLNFLPILGESDNGMKVYNVDSLLTKLKQVYAEKAVRTGFEDDSLYNDELLTLSDVDLNDFKDLKDIVGTTNNTKLPKKININEQGLTDEEYEKGEQGKKKKPKERTEEEKAAIEKIKAAKKQRKVMISILRGISIRIPMMIYGMDIDVEKDVDINTFVDLVDEVSWREFMPQKVTKELFKRYAKYYDPEVFVEAGRIIRRRAKSYDNLDYVERTEKIADLFGTFKNPDKETVLTPWRVVNLQLSTTLGGIRFFDEQFKNTTSEGNAVLQWHNTEITNDVFLNDAKFLEINSKTGLYPLYIATSLFYKRRDDLNVEKAGGFDLRDEEKIIQEILEKNIYVISKTPMAQTITKRTLAGYKNWSVNICYIENLVSKGTKTSAKELIRKEFNDMKFDVIIGNPPYSESDGGAQASATPIYQHFVNMAKELNPKYLTLIIPSRWYVGGKGLDAFRDQMLNDIHLRELHDWLNPDEVFPNTNIRGGVCYFLRDSQYNNQEKLCRVVTYQNNSIINDTLRTIKIKGLDIFIREQKSADILSKINKERNMQEYASSRKPFGFDRKITKNKIYHETNQGLKLPVKCYDKDGIGYLEYSNIQVKSEWINKWKIFTARANNIGTELNDDNFNIIIGEPKTICTETYIAIGADLDLDELETKNLGKYLQTKFSRFLHSLAKSSQDAAKSTYRFIPLEDFSEQSDIIWSKSLKDVDQQLYKKYGITDEEVNFINGKIKDM